MERICSAEFPGLSRPRAVERPEPGGLLGLHFRDHVFEAHNIRVLVRVDPQQARQLLSHLRQCHGSTGLRRAGSRIRRHGSNVLQLPPDLFDLALGDLQPAAFVPQPLLAVAQLRLQAREQLEVRLKLLRQLAHVLVAEDAQLVFRLLELGAHRFEFGFQKVGGADRLLFAVLQVLIDEIGRQRVGDFHRLLGVMASKGDRKSVRAFARPRLDQVDLYVFAQLFEPVFHEKTLVGRLGKKLER